MNYEEIMKQEAERYKQLQAQREAKMAAELDAQSNMVAKYRARQSLGGHEYANAQAKMDAAMQANQEDAVGDKTKAAQIDQNTQLGLGASQQVMNLANQKGEGAGNIAQSGVTGAMGGAMMGTMMAGAGSGAAAGAASGSMAGPIGAGIGAAVGIGVGLLQAKAAKEQRIREAQAAHFNRISDIEKDKAARIGNALQNMGAQMSVALQVPVVRI